MNQPESKISPLVPGVATFLDAAERAGYERRTGRQNISVLLDGRFVGGWNMLLKHWYITAASAIGHEGRLQALRFRRHNRTKQGCTWILPGAEHASTFGTALAQVTGVSID